uniref:Uncharacterized protein n=1 Tax=Timema douglasi TaxID=61478 RepID=A0A7R8VGL0_TIMDO|nr:unnamed protein product [Timema douglasi]
MLALPQFPGQKETHDPEMTGNVTKQRTDQGMSSRIILDLALIFLQVIHTSTVETREGMEGVAPVLIMALVHLVTNGINGQSHKSSQPISWLERVDDVDNLHP